MKRSPATLPLALAATLGAGCASEPVALDTDRTEPMAVPAGETPALEPAPVAHAESPPASIPSRPVDPDDLSVRDDGRPSWWFSGRRSEGDATILCAEALGPDMNAARSGAILAARTRLRHSLALDDAAPLPEVTVLRTWVWPLPNAATGAANRYAGYVMVEATAAP